MNEALLDLINGDLAGRSRILDTLAEYSARDALFVLVAFAGAFGLVQLARSRRDGIRTAAAVGVAAAIAGIGILLLSSFVHEARPFVNDADTIQLIPHALDNSFPSDHSTLAAVIGVVAAFTWRRWAALFLSLVVVVGLSRVIVGVHYPGDVAAGWVLGGGAALAACYFVARVESRVALPRLAYLR